MAQSEALQLLVERMFAACLSKALSSHSCPLVLSVHAKPARFYLAWPVGHRSQPSMLAGTLFSSRTLRLLMIDHLPLATVSCRPPDLCIVSAAPLGMFKLSVNFSLEESLSSTHFLKVPLGRWLFNTWCGIPDPAPPSTWLCQALLSLHVD